MMMEKIERDLTLLQWMVGINTAFVLAIAGKLFL